MVLVTGATGLVGSHLILQLITQGNKVRAMYRTEAHKVRVRTVFEYYQQEKLFDTIDWIQADILDIPSLELAFENVTHVYHCAAYISFDPKEEEKLRKVNIEGTANVVNCCIDFGVQKLCHVSSIAALGDLKEFETIITEETEWNPEVRHNDYAITKYGGEMEVWRGYQEGLAVVIVNPGVIIGPLFWREGSGEIYNTVQKGISFYTAGATGFVAVQDVVRAMLQLMSATVSGERFILVGKTISYYDLVSYISGVLKVRKPHRKAGKFMLGVGWRLDWFFSKLGKKRTLTRDLAKSLHTQDFYDANKIKKVLPFEFSNPLESINALKLRQ